MPSHPTTLLPFTLAILVLTVLDSRAQGQATAPDSNKPGAGAAAGNAVPLPDAPSFVGSSQSSAGDHIPLEQQPHPKVTVWEAPFHMLQDGKHIFVAPIYVRRNDLKWLLPLAGASAVTLATDPKTMRDVVSTDPSFNQASVDVSDGLTYGFIALPVTMFGFGEAKHNEHLTETGILGSQAMGEAYIVDEAIKLCTWRERPTADHSNGEFFIGSAGANSSFISGHSVIAWSSAAVIAGEYPSKWVQAAVYTAATGVALTRVMGQQHFPTDVLLGSAEGWLVGHFVFRAHHHWLQAHPRSGH